jgi:hypothetical protein
MRSDAVEAGVVSGRDLAPGRAFVSCLEDSRLPTDEATEAVPDFRMLRDRRSLPIGRILVDVVPRTMADEGTTGSGEFTDELTALQGA